MKALTRVIMCGFIRPPRYDGTSCIRPEDGGKVTGGMPVRNYLREAVAAMSLHPQIRDGAYASSGEALQSVFAAPVSKLVGFGPPIAGAHRPVLGIPSRGSSSCAFPHSRIF